MRNTILIPESKEAGYIQRDSQSIEAMIFLDPDTYEYLSYKKTHSSILKIINGVGEIDKKSMEEDL